MEEKDFKNIQEKVMYYLEKIKKEDSGKEGINAFLEINPDLMKQAKALDSKKAKGEKLGKLFGKVIGVKSNINVKGLKISCASKTLENYKGTYDATVIKKIKEEDGLIMGMLNCDEFASGSSGENSGFGATRNPKALRRIPGGSSSGSAAAVSAGFCDMSLGSDTGGSIRNPASHCGVVGVKPSYGAVSRYGLVDLSMSLDQIGPLGRNVEDVRDLLNVISGKDDKDTKTEDFEDFEEKNGFKIGVLNLEGLGIDPRIKGIVENKVEDIKKKLGWDFEKVEIKHFDLALQTYYLLVYAEFFSGTRKFDGRRFGKKIEENSGKEVLRRILGGKEITKAELEGKYYEKALKVRNLISKEFSKVFEKVDCIILPVVPFLPWEIGRGLEMKPEEVYAADVLTVPASLAGISGMSLPCGVVEDSGDEIPIGIQILCDKGKDFQMLDIAEKIEQLSL
jgi:aspartyl-tRNA(Asn)/glutamyl-tRNA(Gln) amidotransferase subunit A